MYIKFQNMSNKEDDMDKKHFVFDLWNKDCAKIKKCWIKDKTEETIVDCTLYKWCWKFVYNNGKEDTK